MPVRVQQLVEPVTIADLWNLGMIGVDALPILAQGQFDNLRFDNGKLRLWSTRSTVADYNGDVEAFTKERYVVEELRNGRWERVGCLCPGCRRPPEAYVN
jgi:hypothetical protein